MPETPPASQAPAGPAIAEARRALRANLAVLFTGSMWFAYGLVVVGGLWLFDASYTAVACVVVPFCLAAAVHICQAWEKHQGVRR